MEYQESTFREPFALEVATLLHSQGIATKYVGNHCFEFRIKRSLITAFDVLSKEFPALNWKAFTLFALDGKRERKYFLECTSI